MSFLSILLAYAIATSAASVLAKRLGIKWLEGGPLYLQINSSGRMKEVLLKPAKTLRKTFTIVGDLSTALAIPLGLVTTAWLVRITWNLISSGWQAPPSVLPPIPGFTLSLSWGVVLALFLTLLAHELGHAYAAVGEGLQIKKIGFFVLLLIPGAFVELDERELLSLPPRRSARVLSSGIGANLILAILLLLVGLGALQGFPRAPSGIYVERVVPDSPSWGIIQPGTVIYAMNSTPTPTIDALSSFLRGAKPGDLVILDTSEGPLSLRLGSRPDNQSAPWMGVLLSPLGYYTPRISILPTSWAFELSKDILLAILFNLSAAAINAMPALPLDVGKVLAIRLGVDLTGERGLTGALEGRVVLAVSALIWALLAINLGYSVIRFVVS